mmetsp:Transcript_2258/g.3469  ORF Transcript_2258/g.3469 Transcript_2258/m.3469 type:complete len:696 (-) Transcript_2258:95-2182(-)|eukprot:CAMPEP_0185027838 /NCGR_PEP_ID=MMETSP1103-20130426/13089_1 /TAXON_ID=36769 /ORGANISM="Paraphysomonas bandaiensis, Strain Caron Lab Isolate" /LENGTH=695 /DNA_ID=CAMNT_0027561987 /DNA_START=24 /DNA_END=2111 /DNA_ORIENTATION=+
MATTFELLVVEVILMLILVGYLVKYYKSPMVTMDVTIATYISWALGFAGTVLLPFDMAITLVDNERSKALDELWSAIYWSTFVLAWIILPVQMAYHLSGEFTCVGKLLEALKSNCISYMAGVVVMVIFIIYVAATKGSAGAVHFIGFMMAMGNTYGVVLIILLMGNGLVALPRRLWHMGNTGVELTRLYLLSLSVETAFHDARFELEDCEAEVKRVMDSFESSLSDRSLKPLADIIQQRVQSFDFALRSTSNKHRKMNSSDKVAIDKKSLVALHGRVKRAQLRVTAAEHRWRNLLLKVKVEESLLDGTLRIEEAGWCEMKTVVSPRSVPPLGSVAYFSYTFLRSYDSVRFFWRKYLYTTACRVMSVICGLASCLIFYSELNMSSNSRSPIGDIIVGLSSEGAGVFIVQSIAFAYLFYMSLCTFWSLFKMNLGWSFTLQGPHQSPDSSLLFNATYLSRLQFSLGYNFLLFLNVKKIENTSFQGLMESMQFVPLFGDSFSIYAPIITAVVGLFTLFNVYARIMKFAGFEDEDSVAVPDCCHKLSEQDKEELEAGKKLVAGQLRALSHQLHIQESRMGSPRDTAALLSKSPLEDGSNGTSSDADFEGDIELQEEKISHHSTSTRNPLNTSIPASKSSSTANNLAPPGKPYATKRTDADLWGGSTSSGWGSAVNSSDGGSTYDSGPGDSGVRTYGGRYG